jgi:hypothetical protein
MKITEFPNNILYIEDAIPLAKEFLKAIEYNDDNEMINKIIPKWDNWMDGYPEGEVWIPTADRGYLKNIDWDYTINHNNGKWPRTIVGPDYSPEHAEAYKILKMIDEPFKDALDVWCEKTNNKIDFVTKNYIIKKYKNGQHITTHTDRDHNHDHNTYDWTALIYLNDDYEGGSVLFNDLGLEIKPSAGSILFFSTDEVHTANTVIGNKSFMFFYIQSKYNFVHSITEHYHEMIKNIIKDRSNA